MVVGVVALVACASPPRTAAPPPFEPSGEQISRSPYGMVVSASAIASEMGARILEAGGNAVDAAVTTAFALAVVEPSMSGIGGRTQILIRTVEGEFFGIDGTTQVPERPAPGEHRRGGDAYGYGTIGIPGTVAALTKALDEHGSLSLPDVLAPAVTLAEEGFALPALEADRIAAAAELAEFEGSRETFFKPGGVPYRPGERFVQPQLAATLKAIAAGGADAYYRGAIAKSIVEDMAAHGGAVSAGDLTEYLARDARIVRGTYRGFGLVGTYLPASGATTIEALQILQHFDRSTLGGSVTWAAIVAQALLLSFEDRVAALGPPAEQARLLVSQEWAAARAADIRVSSPRVTVPRQPGRGEWEHTTHLSVIDRWGGVVALTQSLGPSLGSKVVTPGLGFLYAATMGYLSEDAPGARAWSSQSPLIVLRQGKPAAVLGAAGARRIISSLVQVVSRVVDHDLSLAAAVYAPRLHPTDGRLFMEVRRGVAWTERERADLRAIGFDVDVRSDARYFARIHGIQVDGLTGEYIGVADPRGEGGARGARW